MATALTIARVYQHSFDSHPNITLAITGGCLNALADVVAQVSQNTVSPNFINSGPLSVFNCQY
jgi:protein Mpv17